jgi:hypothetical protein
VPLTREIGVTRSIRQAEARKPTLAIAERSRRFAVWLAADKCQLASPRHPNYAIDRNSSEKKTGRRNGLNSNR